MSLVQDYPEFKRLHGRGGVAASEQALGWELESMSQIITYSRCARCKRHTVNFEGEFCDFCLMQEHIAKYPTLREMKEFI
jgi:hypothetical protein